MCVCDSLRDSLRDSLAGLPRVSVDPYCYVSFTREAQKSIILEQTIMPTWDQTLIFDDIELYGDPKVVQAIPPDVCIELFDKDLIVSVCSLTVCALCVFLHVVKKAMGQPCVSIAQYTHN